MPSLKKIRKSGRAFFIGTMYSCTLEIVAQPKNIKKNNTEREKKHISSFLSSSYYFLYCLTFEFRPRPVMIVAPAPNYYTHGGSIANP